MILCPHKHDTMLSHARAAEGHQKAREERRADQFGVGEG
jgi:hypothetical protein